MLFKVRNQQNEVITSKRRRAEKGRVSVKIAHDAPNELNGQNGAT